MVQSEFVNANMPFAVNAKDRDGMKCGGQPRRR